MSIPLAFLLLSILTEVLGAPSFPLTWKWSNPTPHGNNIIDVANNGQYWIQVAERGQFYTSSDWEVWTPGNSGTTAALRSVTFFNGRLIITGESGTVRSGATPTTLTLTNTGSSDWLEGVSASGQIAVAVGDNAAVYTSTNGLTWKKQSVPITDWLRSVTYGTPNGAGLFVAVGESGAIITSTDGVHWQTQSRFTTQNLNRVVWYQSDFWAVGEVGTAFQSTSGTRWRAAFTGVTNTLSAFAGFSTNRVIGGESEVRFQSATGTWSSEMGATKPYPPPLWNYLSATTNTNGFLLCGRSGMMVEGLVGSGTNVWFGLSDSLWNWLWEVKKFPEIFLAVGDRATLLSSTDGFDWQAELPPDSATNSIFLGIGGRTNLAVAVGNAGTIITSPAGLQDVVSTNLDGTLSTNQVNTLGLFWNAVSPAPTTADLQGITTFGDQIVVSGGSGTILTSSDGLDWNQQATPTTAYLSSLAAFPQGIVAVGKDGVILSSTDAVNWVKRSSGTANWIYRVRYLNNQLVAVGQNGSVLTSANGTNWTLRNAGTTNWLNDIDYIDGTYFAVGNQGTVLSSPDTVTWTDRGTITGKSLFGLTQDRGMLIAVGVEGTVLRSQVVPLPKNGPILKEPPADVTVSCDSIPAPAVLTAIDDCDANPVVTLTETNIAGACPQSYTIVRTWTATDSCGMTATKSQRVTVVDTIPPVLNDIPLDMGGPCATLPPPANVTATDNCDPNPVVSFSETKFAGNCPNSYTLVRTWTATDACGNQSSKSQTVVVTDFSPPTLVNVPADVAVACGAIPGRAEVTAVDDCDSNPLVTFNETQSGSSCQDGYTVSRTWTATDSCGNQTSQTQVISVFDAVVKFVKFPRSADEKAFLFSGRAGQKFSLDRSSNVVNWVPGPVLQIESSGTLLFNDGNSNSPQQQFYRATLQP